MENKKISGHRVTAVFQSSKDADSAFDALILRGFTPNDISVVMSDSTHKQYKSTENSGQEKTHAVDDAGRGALLGGATGGIATAIAAISTNLALPGLGLLVVGPLLAGVAGAVAGGVAGGTIGAIVGSGFPKEEADYYETSIKEGGIIVSVTARDLHERDLVIEDMKRSNGRKIYADDRNDVA
jgi:hypothetical protein